MRPLASWEKKDATWHHAEKPDANCINWLIAGLGMILYNPLQKRNDDKSLFFFWLGITTVVGSDIRRSPPGMLVKPAWKRGKTTSPSTIAGLLNQQQYEINQDLHHFINFINLNPTVGITINQPRFTSFHNLLWLGKFGNVNLPTIRLHRSCNNNWWTYNPTMRPWRPIDSRRENDGWSRWKFLPSKRITVVFSPPCVFSPQVFVELFLKTDQA